jgi:hypothetical protein
VRPEGLCQRKNPTPSGIELACSAVPQYFAGATSNLQQNKKPWHHYYFMEKAYTKIILMGKTSTDN